MFTREYKLFASVIRNDFSSFLNFSVSFSIRILMGRLFHNFGPAREKDLCPYTEENLFSIKLNVLGFDITTFSINESGAIPHTFMHDQTDLKYDALTNLQPVELCKQWSNGYPIIFVPTSNYSNRRVLN